MTKRSIEAFQRRVYAHFDTHGRTLPWRRTKVPYRILVSEVMLQQTQVDRVAPKYRAFIRRFPSVHALAAATLAEVLREWQGLGYNRRARALHECAKTIVREHGGRVPREYAALAALPGVGPYTAGAVLAFAFSVATPLIETNIRTVYLHHFFPRRRGVADTALLPIIEATLDRENPARWYAALMDYGAHLKQTLSSHNARSRHYVKQTTFVGSDRQIRGAILRTLSESDTPTTAARLKQQLSHEPVRIMAQLNTLVHEGLISRVRGRYALG